ncbi:hypothetical protein [uncultured Acetatifactor sp.]|nr:hypothetical protein [uncultured Acetatifactor sp.]
MADYVGAWLWTGRCGAAHEHVLCGVLSGVSGMGRSLAASPVLR